MKAFDYISFAQPEDALREAGIRLSARFIGGGTSLVDLMREGIEQPDALIDINALDLRSISETPSGALRINALASNSAIAAHPLARARCPVLSQALLAGASPQLRSMATIGGNILQRTRCTYFYDQASACNKRAPGSGCDAIEGFNRIHAILGAGESCIATHPSDMCVALAALDASVQVLGASTWRRRRTLDFAAGLPPLAQRHAAARDEPAARRADHLD